jgi:O-methyltransferase / aklanonic acid methyltransferase
VCRRIPYASWVTDERVVQLWGRVADSYESVVPYFGPMSERLVTTAEIRPGERVLDVACGKGSSLVPAAVAAGPEGRVVGVDIVPGMVEAARLALAAAGCANGEVVVMDGGALEFPDASFDVVLCANALAFLGMQRALTEFSRVLRPGGRLLASAPTGAGPDWEFFGQLCEEFGLTPMPLDVLAPQEIQAVHHRVGLSEAQLVHETIHLDFPDEQTWWRWAWSHGQRWYLEQLPADRIDEFQHRAFEQLQPLRTDHGIPLDQNFMIAKSTRVHGS